MLLFALFGWGRPLYDEKLARRFLQEAGVLNPPDDAVKQLANRLRRQTLQIRILSVIAALLVILAFLKILP